MRRARLRKALSTFAIIGTTAVITSSVVSQMEGMSPAELAMKRMEAWMALGEPGPEHRKMAESAGTWDQVQTHWMYDGAEPQVSHATATIEPIYGGRYLLERSKGSLEMDGQTMEFEGMGIFGYDNQKQKYFFSWIDNWSTMMMFGYGDADASGDVITYFSEMIDPVTKRPIRIRAVDTRLGPDESRFEMYEIMGPNESRKSLEIIATRTR